MPSGSVILVPSSSSRTGTVHSGLIARNSGVNCSPARRSTCTLGTAMPFSARNTRTRRGLGAPAQSYSFIGEVPRSLGGGTAQVPVGSALKRVLSAQHRGPRVVRRLQSAPRPAPPPPAPLPPPPPPTPPPP